jgi:hypothetical protein
MGCFEGSLPPRKTPNDSKVLGLYPHFLMWAFYTTNI